MKEPGSIIAAPLLLAPPAAPTLAGALLRLGKPGIVLAELLTGLAGMLLAAPAKGVTFAGYLTLFAIVLVAAGAAMLNGLLDAPFDRRMERLAARCRALDAVGPGRVLVVALLLIGGGMSLAAWSAPLLTLLLLAAAALSYLGLYTAWLKRRSPWGVLAGALPGALPPLIGASAVSSTPATAPLLLALCIFIWQLPHFWLLALDCRDQYAQAGIPVLPLCYGEPLTKGLALAAVLLLLPLTLLLGTLAPLSPAGLAVTAAAGGVFALHGARCLYWTQAYRQGFIASLLYLLTIIVLLCSECTLVPGNVIPG